MNFEIKPIDQKLFGRIFTSSVINELDRFTQPFKNWASYLDRKTWAIDDAEQACLILVSMADKMDSAKSYALVWRQNVVLIREAEIRKYQILHVSPSISDRLEEVKEMIREALRLGGELLQVKLDPKSSFIVPDAEFIATKGD